MSAINREQWLTRAVKPLAKLLASTGELTVPEDVRVSCGWPGGRSFHKVIGQCWNAASSNGAHQLFVSPLLHDPVKVLETLLHELIHAADDCESGHKGAFTKAARAVGLAGKPTATYAEEDSELHAQLVEIAAKLGEYPHPGMSPVGGPKKQGTRMLKFQCPECEYTVRTTQKWADVASPICPDPQCDNFESPLFQEEK